MSGPPSGFASPTASSATVEEQLAATQAALRDSNERITQVLESLSDGFVLLDPDWRIVYLNDRGERLVRALGKSRDSLIGRNHWEEFPDAVGTPIEFGYRRALAEQVPVEMEVFYPPSASWMSIRAFPSSAGLSIFFRDITRRKEADAALETERKVLAMIASGAPLPGVLETIAREVEARSTDGMLCSILVLDESGERLWHGGAPSLPRAYNDAIDGLRIGPGVGSCGTAAYERRPVRVSDIASDPLWKDFSGLARLHGLAACYSTPVLDGRGRVLGTIAMYYRDARQPTAGDEKLIALARDLAVVALERERSEQALRRSEERLRATFEQAAVGIASADADARFIEMNRKFCELLGYAPEELRRLTFRELTHPDDLPATLVQMQRLRAGEISDYSIEKRYVKRDGSIIWSHTTVTLTRDAAGAPARFIGVVEDITARKATEEALRQSEQQLQLLADSIPQLAWMAEPDGHIFWYNQRWYRYTGTTHEQMQGWGWQSVHDPEILPSVIQRWRASIATGRPFEMEFPLRGADGALRWFLTRVDPMRDSDGRVVRWFGTNTDIDEVRSVRRALEDETRMLEILNQTGVALASNLDLQALLQKVTDSATTLSGAQFGAFFYNMIDASGAAYQLYTLSGAPREAFENFGHPRATPVFAPTFRGEGIIRSADITRDPRYGRMAPHRGMPPGHLPVRSYLAVPVVSRTGEVVGGLFFGHAEADVFTERTERLVAGIAAQAAVAVDNAKLYESAQRLAGERQQLLESERHARGEAERASRTKDDFLATLSHELRTPLSSIVGWAHLLRARSPTPAELASGLEVIERNARLQTQLIEDLLDMSRITSGKLRLDVQPLQPSGFVTAALQTVLPAAQAKEISVESSIDPAVGLVPGDPARLQQIVWNLLNNAIKFTPRGGKVRLEVVPAGDGIEIRVADNGIGIAPEFLGRMFQRFRQADASTTRRFGGLGLGLSIVRHLVELHGGRVHAESEGAGRGSTFVVHIPALAPGRSEEPERSAAPETSKAGKRSDLSGLKVLVVDDQPDASELAARILADCGAEVFTAGSGPVALELLQARLPDVLLSDIGMPEMDGYELLRRVRELDVSHGGRIPAIAITAFARSEDRTRALRRGFQVHLTKPVEAAELIATVASVAGRTDAFS